jgi:hypothetical protein
MVLNIKADYGLVSKNDSAKLLLRNYSLVKVHIYSLSPFAN